MSLGIYKATKEILRELLKNQNLEITLILSEESKPFFREFKCKKEVYVSKHSRILNKLFFYQFFANRIAKAQSLDILFFPKGHIPLMKLSKIKYVSITHDLIPFHWLKEVHLPSIPISALIWLSIKRADLILTDSEYSKKEIQKFTKKPIRVIPLGSRKVKPKDPHFKKDTVFLIGNKNKHKNLEKTKALLEKYNKINHKNFIGVISSGKLSENELAGYYKYSRFCMFMSSLEGFGLPLVESYSYGTPVVFNNETSLSEIGKGLPGACDVKIPSSVFKAIEEVENLSKKRIKINSRYLLEKYNWKNCGLVIYKNLQSLTTSSSKQIFPQGNSP
jgi:hypothetical protein